MPIQVRFDKHGWHHPMFGRLGRGSNAGRIYTLPDHFGEEETITVPIMDPTSRPPRQVDEMKVTRFKYLPRTAEIIDSERLEELIEEAEDAGEEPPKPVKPRVSEMAKDEETVAGVGKRATAQGAVERTTGKKPAGRTGGRRKAVR
jgi:hypothetical protein